MTNLERRLRRVVHLVLALSIVVAGVALLPGLRVYEDANNCFANGIASLGMTEHHQDACTPSYTKLVGTDPAGGAMAIVLVAAVALGAGIVYRRPQRWTAWLWVVWSAAAGIGTWIMSFDLHLFEHVEVLWPAHVLRFALGMLTVLVLIVTPFIATFTRAPANDSSAIARRRSRSP